PVGVHAPLDRDARDALAHLADDVTLGQGAAIGVSDPAFDRVAPAATPGRPDDGRQDGQRGEPGPTFSLEQTHHPTPVLDCRKDVPPPGRAQRQCGKTFEPRMTRMTRMKTADRSEGDQLSSSSCSYPCYPCNPW